MKGSTVFLTILGVSFLLLGAGIVLTLPGQTMFLDNYPAQQTPLGPSGIGYPVGDSFIIFILPGSEALQFVFYPPLSLKYFGGFVSSSGPVNISIGGIFGPTLIEVNNTLFASYFTALYSEPSTMMGVVLNVMNTGSESAIVVGQSRQYTINLYFNPMFGFGYSLLALGIFLALVGMVGEVVQPEPIIYIPSTARETVSTGLRIWKRIFASTVIPFGLMFTVYELLYFLGFSYFLMNSYSRSLTELIESYVIYSGLLFLGSFFAVVAIGIIIKTTSNMIEGKELNLIQSIKHVFKCSGKMYVAYLIVGFVIYIGYILFIVPGIYLAIIFSLILPAIVITDNGIMESFGTSKMLTGNDKLRTFGVLLASGLLGSSAIIPLFIIAFYAFPPIVLGFDFQMLGVPITSQLIVFNLPHIFAFIILGGIIGATTAIIIPIIITNWFYALGGA